MYFCSRRREKRCRYLLKGVRRARTQNDKTITEDRIENGKEYTSPEDVPDSIAIHEHFISKKQDCISKQQDFEVFLHARNVEKDDGSNSLKIISVSCKSSQL